MHIYVYIVCLMKYTHGLCFDLPFIQYFIVYSCDLLTYDVKDPLLLTWINLNPIMEK